jgi:hypothetical protein
MDQVNVIDQDRGENWALYNNDATPTLARLPSDSVHYAIWSPAFRNLYTFSDDKKDLSNCRDPREFWDQYRFIMSEIFRAIKPGRLITIHAMDLPTSIQSNGFIGMDDFPADNRKLAEDCGFIFHSRTFIRKDPVSAMQRTKAIGLLHKQVVKDSALSRMAIADQLITLRKPGDNDEPISGIFEEYHGDDMTDAEFTSKARRTFLGQDVTDDEAIEIAREWNIIEPDMPRKAVIAAVRKAIAHQEKARTFEDHKSIQIWQRYADMVWTDIKQNDVLSRKVAREEHDERHISPLQLTPVRRCIDLWTNPGEIVLSPFAGIGTAGYVAIELGRRFIGAELKASYYRQACANLRLAEQQRKTGTLFEHMDMPVKQKAGLFAD